MQSPTPQGLWPTVLLSGSRHAWLTATSLQPEIKPKVKDLPFDGNGLFNAATDDTLAAIDDSCKKAKNLGLQQASACLKSRYWKPASSHCTVLSDGGNANLYLRLYTLLSPRLPLLNILASNKSGKFTSAASISPALPSSHPTAPVYSYTYLTGKQFFLIPGCLPSFEWGML